MKNRLSYVLSYVSYVYTLGRLILASDNSISRGKEELMNRQTKVVLIDYITLSKEMQCFRTISFVNTHKLTLPDNHSRTCLKGQEVHPQ